MATSETRMLEHMGEVLTTNFGPVQNDAAISAALSFIGASARTLLVGPGTWTIANNVTIPANVRFVRAPGATITINSGRTLTFNGPYELNGLGGFTGSGGLRINYTGQHVPVAEIATGGSGTSGSPWTGFEACLNALPTDMNIHFQAGYYRVAQTLSGKKLQQWYGDGSLTSHLVVVGGIKGLEFNLDLTFSKVRVADLHIIGDSPSAPTTLDLLTIKHFIYATVERVRLSQSAQNGFRVFHGRNLSVRDLDIDICGASHLWLGGLGVDEWCNAWNMENVTCDTSPAGVKAVNGAVRLEGSSFGVLNNLVCELFAGGRAVVLSGLGHIWISNGFIEAGDDFCFQTTGTIPCSNITIINNHIHSTLPFKISLIENLLEHTNINILYNFFAGINEVSRRFQPGASKSFIFRGNDSVNPELGIWVEGYPIFSRDVIKSEAADQQTLFTNGVAIGTWNQHLVQDPTPPTNFIINNAEDLSKITLRVGSSDAILVQEDLTSINVHLRVPGQLRLGGSAPATTLGTVVAKFPIYDQNANLVGYLPVYNNIT